MPESLADFKTRVQNVSRVPTSVLSDAQLSQAIEAAVERYSHDLPLVTTAQITTNSTDIYTMTAIDANWTEGYTICDLHYRDQNGDEFTVDPNDWQVYKVSGVDTLRLRRSFLETASTTPTVWVTYAYPHTLDGGTSTVRDRDRDPLAALAAAHCLLMYSAEASDSTSSSIVGDSANYGGIPSNLAQRRKELLDEWERHVKNQNTEVDAWLDWDLSNSWGKPLFHGGRRF